MKGNFIKHTVIKKNGITFKINFKFSPYAQMYDHHLIRQHIITFTM